MSTLMIKKIHEEAIIPKYAHKTDSGMDLYSIEEKIIKSGKSEIIRTGIQIQLPNNTEAQVRPRSGLALNYHVTVLNTPGTIDEGYVGEIKIILINHGKEDFLVEKKMRIAQMVIQPVLKVQITEVDELATTDRGDQGFGSTGLK